MSSGTRKDKGKARHNGGNGDTRPEAAKELPHGRVPPHSIGAEKSLLGGIFLDREAPIQEIFDVCAATDFYQDAHRLIAQAMLSLFEDGITIDRVAVIDRLTTLGDLEHAGGEEYIELLDKFVPAAANLGYYAKIIHDKAVARRIIEAASAVAMLGYEQHGEISEFVKEVDKRFKPILEGSSASRSVILPGTVPLTHETLSKPPPPLRPLLRDSNNSRPIFLRGTVGIIAAAGGTGKSSVLGQLAVSLATGLTLFGPRGWAPAEEGRVLLLGGEDKIAGLQRRLYFAAKDIGAISDADQALVMRNVDARALAGFGCALTTSSSFSRETLLPETAFAVALREHLRAEAKAGRPYLLVLIDPLARFAGFDVEKDNAAATSWIEVIESFTKPDCGEPSVIIAHHTRKRGKDERRMPGDAIDLVRGASALKDGSRWVGVLEQQKREKGGADLLTLSIAKANDIPPQMVPLILCRPNTGNEGALRVATEDEIASNEKLLESVKTHQEMLENLREEVLGVFERGRTYSRKEIAKLAHRRPAGVGDIVNQLLTEGLLQEPRKGVLRLSDQLDLDGRLPAVPEDGNRSTPGRQASGSQVPVPSPSPAVKPEGDRELGARMAASEPEVGSNSEKDAVTSQNGNRFREPVDTFNIEEPPPHLDEDAPA